MKFLAGGQFVRTCGAVGTALVLAAACSESGALPVESVDRSEAAISWGTFPASGPTTIDTPIGLALSIHNGVAEPLVVRAGQRFYINQLDLVTALDVASDEGVDGLARSGDFSELDWRGSTMVDQSFAPIPNQNGDGYYTRRRFYRKAKWMERPSLFSIEQLDAQDGVSGAPWITDTGLEQLRTPVDSFFVRRLRAIQWTNDCRALDDCSGATSFREEALVELRYANGPNVSQRIGKNTAKLRLRWSVKSDSPYDIPVTQLAHPEFDYGVTAEVVPLTPPGPGGYYSPGQGVSFQITLRDASGNRLHPAGSLPTYQEFASGVATSGITYWRGPFEPFLTYYRRKHREEQLDLAFQGPKQDVTAIHNVLDIGASLDFASGVVTTALPSTDGFYGAAAIIPNIAYILGGPTTWGLPVSDTYTFDIPDDAKPGTYSVTLKGRRRYLGEETPFSKVIEVQVGTNRATTTPLGTGPCTSCHQNGSALKRINHGLEDRSTCATCHAPLNFELEGPIYVRVHFIHSRSNRLNQVVAQCQSCHLNAASIQRTSKSACLSCHTSYPEDHVQTYGPVVDMYVGGRGESFAPCTDTCHKTHPQAAW